MTKLYKKNELLFALLWIGLYVATFSLADSFSAQLGMEKLLTAPWSILLTVLLLSWIRTNSLTEAYGLQKPSRPPKAFLYYLPLLAIVSTNLWGGMTLNYTVSESALYVVTMICVGILEEVIFRGLLFQSMAKDHLKSAVIVSSLTFGIGHIVNLLNGAPVFDTLLQICYAAAIGFLFTVLFLKSGSLTACILTHATINSLSAFARERGPALDLAAALFLIVVPLAYAFWLIRRYPNKD